MQPGLQPAVVPLAKGRVFEDGAAGFEQAVEAARVGVAVDVEGVFGVDGGGLGFGGLAVCGHACVGGGGKNGGVDESEGVEHQLPRGVGALGEGGDAEVEEVGEGGEGGLDGVPMGGGGVAG